MHALCELAALTYAAQMLKLLRDQAEKGVLYWDKLYHEPVESEEEQG